MLRDSLRQILEKVKTGELTIPLAMEKLSFLPYENIEFARIDHHRHLRTGIPEVVFCEGKALTHIKSIVESILKRGSNLLATRVDNNIFELLKSIDQRITFRPVARIAYLINKPNPETEGIILIITAGTADIPVAEEAKITCEVLGNRVDTLYDVGVAGVHRIIQEREKLSNARVICVIAGMEGALASIVGGMTDRPVIAVPTSVGYGANFKGLSALLTMINSCTPGIAVVNIDNGFGAACLAHKINILGEKGKDQL